MWKSINDSLDIWGLRYWVHSAGRPWSVNRYGDHLRFEVRNGDRWPKDAEGVERAQISSGLKLPYRREVWLSFAFKMERGNPLSVGWTSLVGLHATEDPEDISTSGCFTFHTSKDHFLLITRSSQENPLRKRARDIVRWHSPLERGSWSDFVIRFIVDPYGSGAFQMWRNGHEVVNASMIPLGYVDETGPYLKFGFYRPTAPETTIVHFANIEISSTPLTERIAYPLPIIDGP